MAFLSCRHLFVRFGTLVLLVAFLVLGGSVSTRAAERILEFQSDIDVRTDGSLLVTEQIKVRAEGGEIRRGIYRDIPLRLENAAGRKYTAGFTLLRALRDGEPEAYRVNRSRDGVRIYLGKEDVFLSPGIYTYTISYETSRQVRFFDKHDEVYWNVTGNEWAFAIEHAAARVRLPDGAQARDWTAYTGSYGESGKDFRAEAFEAGNEIHFTTTRPLAQGEGLTAVVTFAKGVVEGPSESQKAAYYLMDHRAEIITGIGLLIVLAYYMVVWWLFGRDPPKGVIIPRFQAPDSISPALSNYIHYRGFSGGGWLALSAACVSLAVKRRIMISGFDDELSLEVPENTDLPPGDRRLLPSGEKAILSTLKKRSSPLTLSKASGKAVATLGTRFRAAIEAENRSKFFRSNWGYVVPGAIISVLAFIALIAFGNLGEEELLLLMPIFMVGIFISVLTVNIGRSFRGVKTVGQKITLVVFLFGLANFFFIGAGAMFSGIFSPETVLLPLPLLAAVLLGINVLFYFLLGAPTALGRNVMDEIEGLKLYLSVAEKDRMNMAGAPEMSPSHFETLLPYAIALGVEKPWADAFQTWLQSAVAATASASAYHPGWYSGRSFDSANLGSSFHDMADSMTGSFVSSLPAPKSSSSGSSGGGFSGGGGGGGGGGGW